MSTRHVTRSSQALSWFSATVMLALMASAALFHGFGLDLTPHGELGIPCVVHWLTHIECPGCGMTRALVLVSQFEWSAAFRMNALVYLLLGIALAHIALARVRHPKAICLESRLRERLAVPALGLTLAHWITRIAS